VPVRGRPALIKVNSDMRRVLAARGCNVDCY
jgi:uncharacterized metal-binding protein